MRTATDSTPLLACAATRAVKERITSTLTHRQCGVRLRLLELVLQMASCLLYVVRVLLQPCEHCHRDEDSSEDDEDTAIRWELILWLPCPTSLWLAHLAVAALSLAMAAGQLALGHARTRTLSVNCVLEMAISLPWIVTAVWWPIRDLFVPNFLACWSGKAALDAVLNDMHRATLRNTSALAHQVVVVAGTVCCLVFTAVCGVQHIQRAGARPLSLFESFYFIMVTFSTVGFGDIAPDIWPSQLFVIVMILIALAVLPSQLEQLVFMWGQRHNSATYRAGRHRHVVVCASSLQPDTVDDFLQEFYAHAQLQECNVVLLSSSELDPVLRRIVQAPSWSDRVVYVQGSALKDADLARAGMENARACFLLSSRGETDRDAADQQTIVRSWAVRDYACACAQYIHLFRPENKMHVQFAECVVCEDEVKFALLACNCLHPGLSTLVTLLVHTSSGSEGADSAEEWQRVYGLCSGNEVYHVRVRESVVFRALEGCPFPVASSRAYASHGVCLLGVQRGPAGCPILLNPGPGLLLCREDVCFYISMTEEEQDSSPPSPPCPASVLCPESDAVSLEETSWPADASPSSSPAAEGAAGHVSEEGVSTGARTETSVPPPSLRVGFPPIPPYVGASPTICHLERERRPLCCLQLGVPCPHRASCSALDCGWSSRAVMVVCQKASMALFDFVVPLRAHSLPDGRLAPIVLLVEAEPELELQDVLSWFPLVFWLRGSIQRVSDLLSAGITLADDVVVVRRRGEDDDSLLDCSTIVSVASVGRLFPHIRVCSEIGHSLNMRFVDFRPDDPDGVASARREQTERQRGSQLSHMFRLPFAAGRVFSASMLDSLLYQSLVKPYLLPLLRLLLGLDQAIGSGHLSSVDVDGMPGYSTYGQLYHALCAQGHVPIGLYRSLPRRETRQRPSAANPLQQAYLQSSGTAGDLRSTEEREMGKLVRARIRLASRHWQAASPRVPPARDDVIAFVLINPPADELLCSHDRIYLLEGHTHKRRLPTTQ